MVDEFIKKLDEKLKDAKANTKWRREYMKLLTIEDEKFAEGRNLGREEGREEGRAEGRAEGQAEGRTAEKRMIYERLISSGKLSPQEASMLTGWNVNTVV